MEASNTDIVRQVLPRRLCLHLLKWAQTAAELGPIEIKAFPFTMLTVCRLTVNISSV